MKFLDYILSFAILVLIIVYFIFPNTVVNEVEITTYDTIAVRKHIEEILTPQIEARLLKDLKPKLVIKTEWRNRPVDMDSLFKVAYDSAYSNMTVLDPEDSTGLVIFTAKDSLEYKDSVTTLVVYSAIISRLPLDPELLNHISLDLQYNNINKNVHIITYEEPTFSHGFGVSMGWGIIHQQFDVSIGYVGRFKFSILDIL